MTTQLYDKRWNPIDTDGLDEKMLLAPLLWKKPRKIFVCSTTDIFGDWVKDEWLDRIFAVMALCQHTFQVLTKRPKRMREYLKSRAAKDDSGFEAEHIRVSMTALAGTPSRRFHAPALKAVPLGSYCKQIPWPLPNVWLGVTAESQETADARIPDLLATPAAVRFVSLEPMLGLIDLEKCEAIEWDSAADQSTPGSRQEWARGLVDWVITGGESGPHARPAHPDWFRSIRDQCAAASVAYFHKQNGEWVAQSQAADEIALGDFRSMVSGKVVTPDNSFYRVGKRAAGRLLDGVEHSAFPATQLKEE